MSEPTSNVDTSAEWFVQKDGVAVACGDTEAFKRMCRDHSVGRDDFVYHAAVTREWKRAVEVPELRDELGVGTSGRTFAVVALVLGGGFMALFLTCVGTLVRGTGVPVAVGGRANDSPERERLEQMFVSRFNVQVKMALADLARSSGDAGDVATAQALARHAGAGDFSEAGRVYARGMSDQQLRRAIADESVIRNIARLTVQRAASE